MSRLYRAFARGAPRRPRRFSTSRLVTLRKSSGSMGDGIQSIYVQGFLADTRAPEGSRNWQAAHGRLVASPLAWRDDMHGFDWRSGADGDRFGRMPLPFNTTAAAAASLLRFSSPSTVAAAVVGDVLANATRLYLQFREAEREARLAAHALAEACDSLGGPYRIVAHSLGCRLVLEAMPLLPAAKRPVEVHLCAAAVTEQQAAPFLERLCAPAHEQDGEPAVFLYYSRHDEVLATAFRLASMGGIAMGNSPPSRAYPRLEALDVTDFFGLLHHSNYRYLFDELVLTAVLKKPRPPPLPSWRIAQSVQLRDRLTHSLNSLVAFRASAAHRWRRTAGGTTIEAPRQQHHNARQDM